MKVTKRFSVFIVLIIVLLTLQVVFIPKATAAKPTIHALLIIMDGDPVNFKQYQQNERWIRYLLQAIENNGVCELKLTTLRSSSDTKSPNPQRILTWVRELTPRSNDVVFIYYCGHGARNRQALEGGTYFNFTGARLYRKELVDTLKTSQTWESRLKILITDTCSVDSSITVPKEVVATSAAVDYRAAKAYRQLFVEHSGFLHVTSATEDEYSWGDSRNGGWFTNSLVRSINSQPDNMSRFVGWKEVFADTKKEVNIFLNKHWLTVGNKIQHPRHYGELPKRTNRRTYYSIFPKRNPNDVPNRLSPEARVQKVWVDHNQFQDSVKGMRIHVTFDVSNFKGKQGEVIAYFYTESGKPLKDTNGRYNTTDGNVSVGDSFQPGHVNTIYHDYTLFMPAQELHLRGKRKLKFFIQVHTGNTFSKLSDSVFFTYTGPEARVQKVWVDHNQFQDSVKGMRIHVTFDVSNFKGKQGEVIAYFYTESGKPLKDTNGRYNTTDGNVSVGDSFQPGHVNTIYHDYTLFMPYQELHLRGKHSLKFYITIFNQGTWNVLSDASDWVYFNIYNN